MLGKYKIWNLGFEAIQVNLIIAGSLSPFQNISAVHISLLSWLSKLELNRCPLRENFPVNSSWHQDSKYAKIWLCFSCLIFWNSVIFSPKKQMNKNTVYFQFLIKLHSTMFDVASIGLFSVKSLISPNILIVKGLVWKLLRPSNKN